jgi:rubrerythrin
MDAGLSLEDVLQIAERVEKRGAMFYRRAADLCPDSAGQKVFAELAEMESQHEVVFAGIREHALNAAGPRVATRRTRAKVNIVFDVLIQGLMEDLQGRFHAKTVTLDILREAIAFEKDTVVFFAQLGETIENPADRKKVQAILREELTHICMLSGQLVGEGPRRRPSATVHATA